MGLGEIQEVSAFGDGMDACSLGSASVWENFPYNEIVNVQKNPIFVKLFETMYPRLLTFASVYAQLFGNN